MPRIVRIKADEKKGIYTLTFSDGKSESYTVGARVYSELGGPCRGDLLSEEELAVIKEEHAYRVAKKKALSILSCSDNNEKTVREKLVMRGVGREIAAEVAREMVSLGYIDEERQLERLVMLDANSKLFGEDRIIRHLASRGYSVKDVSETVNRLSECGEIDFSENRKRLLEKHPTSDREEEKKLLYRYGYRTVAYD